MKSKKLIGAFVSIVMSATFAAGLAGCGGNGDDSGDNNQDTHTHHYTWVADADGRKCHEHCDVSGCTTPDKPSQAHVDAGNDGKCDNCGADMPVQGEDIDMTSEKWAEAFDFGAQYSLRQVQYVEEIGEMEVYADFDGDKTYVKVNAGTLNREMYVEKIDEERLNLYSTTYEYWSKAETTVGSLDLGELTNIAENIKNIFPFDKFEKGELAGEYVSKESYVVKVPDNEGGTLDTEISDVSLVFAGGKIVSAVYKVEGQLCTATFSYGKTVTLPDVLEGEEVTSDEWTAALSMADTNYRMNVNLMGLDVLQYQQDGGNKQFYVTEYVTDATEPYYMYFSKDGNKFYRYNQSYGHWAKEEVSGLTDEIYNSEITGFGYLDVDLSQYSFEAFTYNAESKAYVMSIGDTAITAEFKDKKLVRAVMMDTQTYMSYIVEIVYGDAEVTLPQIPAGEQVSDEEWAAAVAMKFNNFEMGAVVSGGGELMYKIDGDIKYVYRNMGGTEQRYYVKDGNNYYVYTVESGVWTKNAITSQDYYKVEEEMIVVPPKSGFVWNAATGTYVDSENGVEIKFVDKKIDILSYTDGPTLYFSYGTAELTLPEEGSPAEGGGSGNIPQPMPTEKDITEEDWFKLFADAENCDDLTVHKNMGDGSEQYTFNDTDGYIYVIRHTDGGEREEYVYAEENGVVYKYVQGQSGLTKQATEYSSLAEIKTELFSEVFVNERLGDVRELYDNFGGREGNYDCYLTNDSSIHLWVDNGRLANINYAQGESSLGYNFNYENLAEPYWYLEYAGSRVTEQEWNKAFELNETHICIEGADENGGQYIYKKQGDKYYILQQSEADVKEHYYSAEGGKFYRYDDVENSGWITFNKVAISEEIFNDAVKIPSFGTYNYADFHLVEDEYETYYLNSDETCKITFIKKMLAGISCGELNLHINFGIEFLMPTEKLTEAEFASAINAAINATNVMLISEPYGSEQFENYIDVENGIVYRWSRNGSDGDELYITEGSTVYLYKYDGENGFVKTVAAYENIAAVRDSLMQGIFDPEILNGQTVTENYNNFVYEGFGRYVYHLEGTDGITINFNNGNVWTFSDGVGNVNCSFYDYGKADVERVLPWWYTDNINNSN